MLSIAISNLAARSLLAGAIVASGTLGASALASQAAPARPAAVSATALPAAAARLTAGGVTPATPATPATRAVRATIQRAVMVRAGQASPVAPQPASHMTMAGPTAAQGDAMGQPGYGGGPGTMGNR